MFLYIIEGEDITLYENWCGGGAWWLKNIFVLGVGKLKISGCNWHLEELVGWLLSFILEEDQNDVGMIK